jgi:DNA-binding response OmpR family regulator
MGKEKIFIIEDERDIVEMIEYNLKRENFETIHTLSGSGAFAKAKRERPDLIILDLMLPDTDGLEICKSLKQNEITAQIPIIMLTAKAQEADKVAGLELGADDYMAKPFSPRELVARIKAVLRRQHRYELPQKREQGILSIDSIKYKVPVSGKEILLTHTEFKLLEFMSERPGIVLSRSKLLDGVLGYDSVVYDRTIDAHVKSLRKKLGKAKSYIETVRGAGYRFKEMEV